MDTPPTNPCAEQELLRFGAMPEVTQDGMNDLGDQLMGMAINNWLEKLPDNYELYGDIRVDTYPVDPSSPQKAYSDYMIMAVGNVYEKTLDESFED